MCDSPVFVTMRRKTVGMSCLCTLEVWPTEPKRMKYLHIHFRPLWYKHVKSFFITTCGCNSRTSSPCLSHNPASKGRMHACTHVGNDAGVNNKVLILEVLPTRCAPVTQRWDRLAHFLLVFLLSLKHASDLAFPATLKEVALLQLHTRRHTHATIENL